MSSTLARFASVLCGVLLLGISALSQAANYQDWWNNTNLSGMGLNIGQQGQTIFGTWFMYDEGGNPSFLLFFGDLDQNQSLTAELHRYFGPEPPGYDETLWHGEVVGTATIAFASLTAGTFSYQYDGKAGSFPIDRYSFSTIDLSGTYDALTSGIDSNCPADNGSWVGTDYLTITHNGSNLAITDIDDDGTLYNVQINIRQHGTHFVGSGTGSGDSESFTVSITDMQLIDNVFTFKAVVIGSDGCRDDQTVVAVKRPN
jgi:hypothetical protein